MLPVDLHEFHVLPQPDAWFDLQNRSVSGLEDLGSARGGLAAAFQAQAPILLPADGLWQISKKSTGRDTQRPIGAVLGCLTSGVAGTLVVRAVIEADAENYTHCYEISTWTAILIPWGRTAEIDCDSLCSCGIRMGCREKRTVG